ncbi:DUF982 domain-containing protein [Neorhizobium vignae]|jgi:hypothetical protein|uniref:DUF982 domain-containing protein n=1 Tax=Neorhizobium vignae TaxID=690585 RepID=UPI000567CAF2
MLTLKWEKPVRAAGQLIAGPLEAHQFLMHGWPHRKNGEWSAAENSALAALDGRKSPDEAREKFEAALKSAQLN